jgi:aminopeptidase-like protein
MGGHGDENRAQEAALLWVLNMSDGTHSLLDIAERSGIAFPILRRATTSLIEAGLLVESPDVP